MNYKKLIYDGDTCSWFEKVINSKYDLLLCQNGDKREPSLKKVTEDARYIGLFTSATTGNAKCIWNTFDRLMLNARISAREFEVTASDRLVMMAKPWHVAGLSWALMAEDLDAQYTFIHTQKGEVEYWYKTIKEVQPDYLFTVPAVLKSLFQYKDWFVPNIVFGGSPISAEDYDPLSKHTEIIYQGYGQTEAGGLISCHKLDLNSPLTDESFYCYGIPPKEFELRCQGTKSDPKPIHLQSPCAIYERFYDTGDLGYKDQQDQISLVGRN